MVSYRILSFVTPISMTSIGLSCWKNL